MRQARSELDRLVDETLFERMVEKADAIVKREKMSYPEENVVIHVFDTPIQCNGGGSFTIRQTWHADGNVDSTAINPDGTKQHMTRQLEEEDVYEHYTGKRVRIIWNPQISLWFVYLIEEDNNQARFCVNRLELHSVGVFGDIKPKFAPEGSPSFIGTIARHLTLLDNTKAKPITAHPYSPSKLFVGDDEHGAEFTHGKRVLVDGSKMFCKLP